MVGSCDHDNELGVPEIVVKVVMSFCRWALFLGVRWIDGWNDTDRQTDRQTFRVNEAVSLSV